MSNKIHPIIHKLQISKNWKSKWFSDKSIKQNILLDIKIRNILTTTLKNKIDDIIIENLETAIIIHIITTHSINTTHLKEIIQNHINTHIYFNIIKTNKKTYTIHKITKTLITAISTRQNYKTAIKKIIQQANFKNIKGIKIIISGRINAAEIARTEKYTIGNISLIQLATTILYKEQAIQTKYGLIGIKIMISLIP
ncbi:hypothetical protein JSR02_00725 [Candidatus Vidania fulgoroideae]|uniref:Small ribosomal subunit protein uS3 C-terminal domain-containing protein n=1 Tax=Candidatus Vidania fulgoroideorum TaxID=881286 RepID=A0A974X7L3_9PROT|nr:hypothetical protein JSR02_00725 [Candidatus Vidania fulgoroideae]